MKKIQHPDFPEVIQIEHTKLPKKVLEGLKEQRSYIDEFTFYEDLRYPNEYEAWYAGELLALWWGDSWHEPLY